LKKFSTVAALFVLLAGASGACAQSNDISTLNGFWRGSLEFARPDNSTTLIYVGLNVDEGEEEASVAVSAYQISLGEDVMDLRLDGDRVAFSFPFRGSEAAFEGTLGEDNISGVLTSLQGQHPMVLERLNSGIDPDLGAQRLGLYELEDGTRILVGPFQWALSVHDFDTYDYRVFFPRTDDDYVAGPAGLLPAPVERHLSFEGNGSIQYSVDGHVRTGVLSDDVVEREVEFQNGEVTLRGLVVMPTETDGPIPGVVVAWGSGQQDRYGFDALPYYRAVWLAQQGLAAIIWDKRGIGESTGSFDERTMENLAGDMSAALGFLVALPEVDASRVGLLVHSQSGIYGPLTVTQNDNAAYIAAIGSTVLNGEIQEIVRAEQQMLAEGWPEEEAAAAAELQRRKFRYASTREGWDEYIEAYNELVDREWFESIVGSSNDQEHPSWNFWRDGNGFEPTDFWRNVDVPTRYYVGSLDRLNPIQGSIDALQGAFAGDRAALLSIQIYDGAEHSLFEAETGGPLEDVSHARMVPYMEDFLAWLQSIEMAPGE